MRSKVIYLSEEYSHESDSPFEALNVDKQILFEKLRNMIMKMNGSSVSNIGATIMGDESFTGDELTAILAIGARELLEKVNNGAKDFFMDLLKEVDIPEDLMKMLDEEMDCENCDKKEDCPIFKDKQ